MLTRRQLLGGLVACVPLMGIAKTKTVKTKSIEQMIEEIINNHDFSSSENRWLVLFGGTTYNVLFNNCDKKYSLKYNENVRINVDNILHHADGTMSVTMWSKDRLRCVSFRNMRCDEFGIPVGDYHNNENFLKIKQIVC